MYICYICETRSPSVHACRSHLQTHLVLGELTYPIKCRQGHCKSTFNKVYNFVRHLTQFHAVDDSLKGSYAALSSDAQFDSGDVDVQLDVHSESDIDLPVVHRKNDRNHVENLQQEGVAMVASLRANSSIPYSVIPEIVHSVDNMISTTVHYFQSETVNLLRDCGVSDETIATVDACIKRQCDTVNQPLNFLSTRYKQDQFFDNHPLSVKPETVVLGQRFENRQGVTCSIYENYQYVSVEATLRTLLENPEYVKLLVNDKCMPGLVTDCWDGLLYKHHPLLSDTSKFTIAIQLFYDGMGTTYPLRRQSSLCNLGVFYFIVKNLPNVLNSCFANVHLVALCYAQDLKTYGFTAVLSKFVREMKRLTNDGFSGTFPGLGECTIYVSLLQVAGDNLALNSLLGFIESFSVDYFCTMCTASQADIQCKFHETDFDMRSVASYNADIACVTASDSNRHSHGVKADCVLNEIPHFHAVKNFSLDIMHIILEGIVSVELSCVLYNLCSDHQAVSIGEINRRVLSFWSVINVEKCNKPPELNPIDTPGRLYPSMKAVQCWALLKYLPLLLGDIVPTDDKHWVFLLQLSELVDLLFAPTFTAGMIAYMRELIADHLSLFVDLYGTAENGIKLKPKHHLLIHLPTVILQSGPLIGTSCMRYELKNSFFKRCSHIMCNFSNVCKTLAYRHQQYCLFSKLLKSHVRSAIVVEHSSAQSVCALDCGDVLCSRFGIEQTDDVFVATRVARASVVYKAGQHVVIDVGEEPLFGRIELFVCLEATDDWFIVVSCLRTTNFVAHFHSYSVEEIVPKSYSVTRFADLRDFHAVCCYKKTVNGTTNHFVRLPYHVV